MRSLITRPPLHPGVGPSAGLRGATLFGFALITSVDRTRQPADGRRNLRIGGKGPRRARKMRTDKGGRLGSLTKLQSSEK